MTFITKVNNIPKTSFSVNYGYFMILFDVHLSVCSACFGNSRIMPRQRRVQLVVSVQLRSALYLFKFVLISCKFEERFMDFSSKECYFDVFSIPFLLTDVTKIPENFQLELIELQERKDLKMKFMELSKIEFYKNLDVHIFRH